MKLFDCDLFANSFECGHCAFTPVCKEEKCPFVLNNIKSELEEKEEEIKALENELEDVQDDNGCLEDEVEDLKKEVDKQKDEIDKLNLQIENLILYIQKTYDEDFTCTIQILSGV